MNARRITLGVLAIIVCILLIALLASRHKLSLVNQQGTSTLPATTTPDRNNLYTYYNSQYKFLIKYPNSLEATTTFQASYLVGTSWNLYSDQTKNTGSPVISFRKKGSNDVLNAELRIGVSTSSEDIATCTTIQNTTTASSTVINGVPFTTFRETGAAMMHSSDAISYRVVHNNTCYAIDEFIAETNPQVFDPPRTLPYTTDSAWQDLHKALQTFKFY